MITKKSGLTLIEIIAVLIILGIIAAIAIPLISSSITQSKQMADYQDIHALNSATQLYLMNQDFNDDYDFNQDISDSDRMRLLVDEGYLSHEVEARIEGCSYVWNADNNEWLYVNSDNIIVIHLDSDHLDITTSQVFTSMKYFVEYWVNNVGDIPTTHYMYGSLSWNQANYDGDSQTNLYAAQFWIDYFDYAQAEGLNADNNQISDFKIFFDRDINGDITNELIGVYIQMGGDRSIYFSNGVIVLDEHYSAYINDDLRKLVLPDA